MKKIVLSIVTALMVFAMMPLVKAEETVSVYMFSKNGCSACVSAQEYFENLAEENPGLFELVELEVFDAEWNFVSEDLQKLLIATYERFGEDTSKAATPTIVIGDYHTVGLPQDTTEVYDAIVAAKDEEKTDEVKKLADDLDIKIEDIRKSSSNSTDTPEGGKYDAIIVVGIFVVLIGGFAGLVIAGKKQ
ncbi:MAG: hypothetical protein IJN13_03125 [Bacilli bacterium]|nr:hypothetical protein [Bacilli bacterium]